MEHIIKLTTSQSNLTKVEAANKHNNTGTLFPLHIHFTIQCPLEQLIETNFTSLQPLYSWFKRLCLNLKVKQEETDLLVVGTLKKRSMIPYSYIWRKMKERRSSTGVNASLVIL